MKKNVFIILGLALVFGLVLTGCPTEADSATTSAGNSKLSAPSRAVMTQGTMPGADHIFTFTLKDDKRFDVSYRLWAREKGNKSMFEVVFTAGAILTAAELPTKIEFVNTNWTGGGTPPFVKGVPVTGAAIYEHDATQKAVVSTTLNENELVYYGYVSAENLNLDFARAPFQVGDDIEIGVQTVIDTATMPYLQKDIAVNPSDIKWFKSFKRR